MAAAWCGGIRMMPKPTSPYCTCTMKYRVRLPLRTTRPRIRVEARTTDERRTEETMTTVTAADVDIALRRQPLMREFTAAQFDQLMNIAELVEFAPNEVIHREGDESD